MFWNGEILNNLFRVAIRELMYFLVMLMYISDA